MLLSTRQLATELNVPKSWVYSQSRRRAPDGIPIVRVGKYLRFELPAVLEWLKGQCEASSSDSTN